MTTHVYVLQHVHTSSNGNEDVKLIGIYGTEDDAHAAIARLSQQPGFRAHPHGFHIDRYELNKDHWVEGFTSLDEAREK